MSNLKYIQVTDAGVLSGYFEKNGLYDLYDLCFSVAPYFEDIPVDTVRSSFEQFRAEGVLFLCFDDEIIVGFSGAIPLSCQKDVYGIVKDHITDADKYWYHSEIGTHPEYRGKGIASTLLKNMLVKAPSQCVVMRTNEGNEGSMALHRKFGFKMLTFSDETPITQEVFVSRKSGELMPDTRIFMTCEKP